MGYTITFYAIDGQAFARRLQESSEDLLEKIELLDLDGPIGGYNFQAAFSTGYLAGESVGHEA